MITKKQLLSTLAPIMLLLALGPAQAVQSPELITIHGSACQPANLQQAINFNVQWSQLGIFNPNPIGSGRFFWVACPVVFTDDNTAILGTDIFMHLFYNDRDAVNRITCIAQRLAFNATPTLIKSVATTDDSAGTGPFRGGMFLTSIISSSDQKFDGILESAVVVCKLQPQSGIQGLVVDHD